MQLFDGLNDTLRILVTLRTAFLSRISAYSRMAQLQKRSSLLQFSSADARGCAAVPGTAGASAAEVVDSLEAPDDDPDSEARWWARAFAGQCRAASMI